MRPNTTLLQLYLLAPLALCSPIPLVLVEDLEAVSGAAHPPAPVAPSRPRHALPEVIFLEPEEDDGPQAPIDNRPIHPSAEAQPSVVLASPRPVSTEYLLSLARHSWMRGKGGSGGAAVLVPAEVVTTVDSSMTQMEMGVAAEDLEDGVLAVARIDLPCHYTRALSRGHNDVLAVSLIVIFAAVVVIVETFNSAKRLFSRRGAIRLEDDLSSEHRETLSVRAEERDDATEKGPL